MSHVLRKLLAKLKSNSSQGNQDVMSPLGNPRKRKLIPKVAEPNFKAWRAVSCSGLVTAPREQSTYFPPNSIPASLASLLNEYVREHPGIGGWATHTCTSVCWGLSSQPAPAALPPLSPPEPNLPWSTRTFSEIVSNLKNISYIVFKFRISNN